MTRRVASRTRRAKTNAIPAPPPDRAAPLPRITRLMALAILFDELLRTGQVSSMAELARICRVSRARVSQVVDLLCLAPGVQRAILGPRASTTGTDAITERQLRSVVSATDWAEQERLYERLQAA